MLEKYDKNNILSPDEFTSVYALLARAFSAEERRTQSGQYALLEHPHYKLYVWRDENSNITALLAAYEMEREGLYFIEHFVVTDALRGQGMGGKILDHYVSQKQGCVVLEAEPAGSAPMAQRRIAFYERHGFYANPYPYEQPPLQQGFDWLPLQIMSYRAPLQQAEFSRIRDVLYQKAYRVACP